MTVMERLANSIVVPVVVLDKVEDAIPTAKAMAAGGVDTMEITFRTACAPECIKAVQSLQYNCGMITFRSGSKIRVYADPAMPWTLDGEREEGHEMVDVCNIHHGVRIMRRKPE